MPEQRKEIGQGAWRAEGMSILAIIRCDPEPLAILAADIDAYDKPLDPAAHSVYAPEWPAACVSIGFVKGAPGRHTARTPIAWTRFPFPNEDERHAWPKPDARGCQVPLVCNSNG